MKNTKNNMWREWWHNTAAPGARLAWACATYECMPALLHALDVLTHEHRG